MKPVGMKIILYLYEILTAVFAVVLFPVLRAQLERLNLSYNRAGRHWQIPPSSPLLSISTIIQRRQKRLQKRQKRQKRLTYKISTDIYTGNDLEDIKIIMSPYTTST